MVAVSLSITIAVYEVLDSSSNTLTMGYDGDHWRGKDYLNDEVTYLLTYIFNHAFTIWWG